MSKVLGWLCVNQTCEKFSGCVLAYFYHVLVVNKNKHRTHDPNLTHE